MTFLYLAQIKAKGNNIVEAAIKIVDNGSYSFSLPEGGTFLRVTVDVTPCRNCQQGHTYTAAPQPQGSVATPGESVQTIQPFHHQSTSPTAIEQVRYGLLYRRRHFITIVIITSLNTAHQARLGCMQ